MNPNYMDFNALAKYRRTFVMEAIMLYTNYLKGNHPMNLKTANVIFSAICVVSMLLLSGSVRAQQDEDDCARLQTKVQALAQGGDFKQRYDTSKYAIEHCANAQGLVYAVWHDFGAASTGCKGMSSDKNRWLVFRNWLKDVLYINPDSHYYCEDVHSILSTFNYVETNEQYDYNGALAVIKYLLDTNRCLGLFADFNQDWKRMRRDQYDNWLSTIGEGDPNHQPPLDTTLPSLEDLDLQILRGPQYAAVKNAFSPSTSSKMSNVHISENPFKDETTLLFTLSDNEYMRLDIYDVLGKQLYTASGLYLSGNDNIIIPGTGLPSGELYARLTTMGGEVRTVKLIKE